jgi:hypothetical protein
VLPPEPVPPPPPPAPPPVPQPLPKQLYMQAGGLVLQMTAMKIRAIVQEVWPFSPSLGFTQSAATSEVSLQT